MNAHPLEPPRPRVPCASAAGSASIAFTLLLSALPGRLWCGGGSSTEPAQDVPTASEIATAQATLDGTVPTDDSIASKQAALDADANRDPD